MPLARQRPKPLTRLKNSRGRQLQIAIYSWIFQNARTMSTAAKDGHPRIVQKENRHSSGCDPMVVAEHSAEALSALDRVMG